jgi:hypothetical protein
MAPSEGAGGGGELGASVRRRAAVVGHGWTRPANISHGRPLLATVGHHGGPLFLSSLLLVWRRHGGGVRGLVGAYCWCRSGAFGYVRALPVEVLRR